MKNDGDWKVLTKDLDRTLVYWGTKQVIIQINAEEIGELYRETLKSIKYWRKHNRDKKQKLNGFFKHLNKETSFLVKFK